jgi:hypothetical protein
MNEEEITALVELEVTLAAYLQVVLGESEELYAPENSTVVERLRFIGATLEGML